MSQDRLDEEHIRVAQYPQIAPEFIVSGSMNRQPVTEHDPLLSKYTQVDAADIEAMELQRTCPDITVLP